MIKRINLVHFALVFCSTLVFSLYAQSTGKEAFQAKCASCHSIGSGDLIGPDLKDLSKRREIKWILGFIQDPGKYLDNDKIGKELLVKYKMKMPNLGISANEAKDLAAYIDTQSGGNSKKIDVVVPTGDAINGKKLFLGKVRLEKGGVACISCHSVAGEGKLGGGTLGPNLTDIFKRSGTSLALTLKSLPFPTMKGIFDKKPLVEKEVNDLYAYFSTIKPVKPGNHQANFIYIGLGGFIIVMMIFAFVWRNRLRDVRRKLVEGEK